MSNPEGSTDGDDQSLPEDQNDDEDDVPCSPQDIWKARSEDLGDTQSK